MANSKHLLPGDTTPEHKGRRALWFMALATVVTLLLTTVVFMGVLHRQKDEVLANLENRTHVITEGRADVLSTWLDGKARIGRRLTENQLFRLFVAELGNDKKGDTIDAALTEQFPYMQAIATEFAKQNELIGVYLIGTRGQALLANVKAPQLIDEQRQAVTNFPRDRKVSILPARAHDSEIAIDIILPVYAPQRNQSGDFPLVGYLLMSVPSRDRLGSLLASGPFAARGESTHIVQVQADGAFEIRPDANPAFVSVAQGRFNSDGTTEHFSKRSGISGATEVFSYALHVTGTPWWLVQEQDVVNAMHGYYAFKKIGTAISVLFMLLVVLAMTVIWRWQLGERNRALADQYRELAAEIQAQQQLLESINGTINEQISVKDQSGRYLYVNPAFIAATGAPIDLIIGADDNVIFEQDTANRFATMDKRIFQGETVTNQLLLVRLLERLRYLQISKTLLRDDAGNNAGIVTVGRDVTAQMMQQKERERTIKQAVAALDQTVGLADPHLQGHSLKVKTLTLAVAKRLRLDSKSTATLEIAAELSQIGKLSVPKHILTAEHRLNDEEMAVMQRHISYTAEVLSRIDFRLPVSDTVSEMHERLDGSGYPQGKQGEAISLPGRILGACDYFVARTSERAYRGALSSTQALQILTEQTERFDARVVAALRQTVENKHQSVG